MIDNALRIMLFMWITSGVLLGVQYIFADQYGYDLTTPDGEPMKSHLLQMIDEDRFNEATRNISAGSNGTWNRVEEFDISAAYVMWELVRLLTGSYVYNILLLFGVPPVFVTVFVLAHWALLARAIVGYLLGR